jgi:hypothetical protein
MAPAYLNSHFSKIHSAGNQAGNVLEEGGKHHQSRFV